MEIFSAIIILIISYLLGSIPFGLLITKYAGQGDIRKIGSGNIGATNVMRTGNKKLGIATFILDALKGLIPVLIAKQTGNDILLSASAILAVLGHVFPIWLKFKGGKGVATAIASFFGLYWLIGVAMCVFWYGIFKITRISAFASITSVILTNIVSLYFTGGYYIFFTTLIISVIVLFKHKANIVRILRGEESSF